VKQFVHDIILSLRKEFYSQTSYKSEFIFSLGSIFVSFFIAYFMTKVVSPEKFGRHGYLFFSIIGGLNFGLINTLLYRAAGSVINGRLSGTLMPSLFAYGSISRLILCTSFYPLISSIIAMEVQLILLFLFIPGLDFSLFPALAAVAAFPSLAGLSMMAVAFTLIFKKNIFTYIISLSGLILGGVSFPVEILHPLLRKAASLHPLTHLNTMVRAYLNGDSWLPSLYPLLLLSALYIISGYLLLKAAENHTKKRGELFNW
jgi:ABC-type polysaccharide/polyol phosphate export permease